MGKLTSYLVGVTAALTISYYLLSSSYAPLISWLGPVLGPVMIFPFSLIFLLLGNPLSSGILFLSWILIGALVGLGARKGTRAISGAIAVYFTTWAFLGLSVLTLVQGLSGSSIFGSSSLFPGSASGSSGLFIPPMPPGVTVSAILSEPLFQSVISLLPSSSVLTSLGGASSGSGAASSSLSISSVMSTVTNTFLPNLIINLAIFLVVSGVIGRLVHMGLYPRKNEGGPGEETNKGSKTKKKKTRKVKVVRRRLGSTRPISPSRIMIYASVLVTLLVALSASVPTASPSGTALFSGPARSGVSNMVLVNSTLGLSSVPFTMGIETQASAISNNSLHAISYGAGVVSTNGNVYNAYAFLNSTNSTGAQFLSSGAREPILSAVFISDGIQNLFTALSQDGIIANSVIKTLQSNRYYNLIPQSAIILIYPGNLSQNSASASATASTISSSINGSVLQKFLSISISTGQIPNVRISIYAYSLSAPVKAAETSLAASAGHFVTNDGMFTTFDQGISSGYLVPGSTGTSMNGSIFVAGQINPSELPSELGTYQSAFNASSGFNMSNSMIFAGGIFVRSSVYHSSSTTHTISGADVFGYGGNIRFGDTGSAYALSLFYPYVNSNSRTGTTSYASVVYSTMQNFTILSLSNNTEYHLVNYGDILSLSGISASTNATFPADLEIQQNISSAGGNVFNVTIKMTNRDTSPLTDVRVAGNTIIGTYGNTISVTGGNLNSSTVLLSPGQSLIAHYSVRLNNIGSYYLISPLFNYTMDNNTYSIPGHAQAVSAQSPHVWDVVNHIELTSFTMLSSVARSNALVTQLFPGFYVFDSIFALIIVLDAYFEYRAFRKWRSIKKETEDNKE